MRRKSNSINLASFLLCFVTAANAQSGGPDASEAAARAALSVLSIAATPNEALSSLTFLTAGGETSDLRSTQLRGGRNPFGDGFYIEGLIAYQNYNPTQIFPDLSPDVALDVRWVSVAVTLGLGWDINLPNNWTVRPAGHFSLGHVTANATLVDFPPIPNGAEIEDAVDGSLNSLGVGASLSLIREVQLGAWEAEYRFRQTILNLYPIGEPQAGSATAHSNQTSLFARHRLPLRNFTFLNHSTKLVLDAGMVLYHGDEANVLGTDWLVLAGAGFEFDIAKSSFGYANRGRVMLNFIRAEEFDGLSLGFGISF